MSCTTALAVTPNQRPVDLAEFRNGHGWSPSIWRRLLKSNYGYDGIPYWGEGERHLDRLWQSIEELPEWQQAPLVLTFDTGVIPRQAFGWAADMLTEFDERLPAPEGAREPCPGHGAGSRPSTARRRATMGETDRTAWEAWKAHMRSRYRNWDDPCPTCHATYGLRVNDPDRCGVCITGLSISGNPIIPVRGDDGVMRCPTCQAQGATCDLVPHEEWPDAWTHNIVLPHGAVYGQNETSDG